MPKRKLSSEEMEEQRKKSAVHSRLIDCVRIFIEENLPDDAALLEKRMFGMDMFLVRGNMFMGLGLHSQRLLVRIGEEAVAKVLAENLPGVARCTSASGQTFPGTCMVEARCEALELSGAQGEALVRLKRIVLILMRPSCDPLACAARGLQRRQLTEEVV